MKKYILLLAVMFMAVSCTQKKDSKALVLYYSQTNTTAAVAQQIADKLGADIEEITVVNPYDGSYQETIQRCMAERESGQLPEVNPIKSNLDDYDVIFFGYPIWFGTCALPAISFLKTVDFSGKTIVPFCTFGSGGLLDGIKEVKAAQPAAIVLDGYGVRAARINAMPAEVDRFLKENGFLEGEFEKPGDFSAVRPVTEEESAIFDAAVGTYPMIQAKASKVCSRAVNGGTEYIFEAEAPAGPGPAMPGSMKIYVLDMDGQDPEFTQVVR